jgi:predicted ATPase
VSPARSPRRAGGNLSRRACTIPERTTESTRIEGRPGVSIAARHPPAARSIHRILGAYGSGKTSLYRAMQLTGAAATGALGRAFAEEGGLPSVLWAGPRLRREAPRVHVELRFDALTYSLTCGQPNPRGFGFESRFRFDPLVEEEQVGVPDGKKKRPLLLLDRGHQTRRDDRYSEAP